jgi:hypothetical protein
MLADMPPPTTLPRRRASAQALVATAHVLAVLLLARLGAWSDRGAPAAERPPLLVRLLSPLPSPVHRAPSAVTLPAARVPAAAPVSPPAPAPAAPAISAAPTTLEAPAPVPAPAPPPPAPPPLNLALPRGASAPWRQRLPALDDPRSNSARATFESELRAAMGGDGRWALERIDDDHIRWRNGSTCIDIRRSRSEQLDGFNRGFSPKPWMAGDPPYRC